MITTYIRTCPVCNRPWETVFKTTKYCSRPCYYQMKRLRGDRVHWTTEMRERFSERQKGANNPGWRGGTTKSQRTKELSTIRYKRFREAALKRDDYRCVKCGSGERLWLDHIIRWADAPSKRWDLNNVQTLCYECNLAKTREEGRKFWINQHGRAPAHAHK